MSIESAVCQPVGRPSERVEFHRDVIGGLSRTRKEIPSKYFYDARGSRLFDQICELPEYYPTRTETGIMRRFAGEMGEQVGGEARVVEWGSGSSVKTRILLNHLEEPVAYVPVDISREHLESAAERLAEEFPEVEVLPVAADFTKPFALPEPNRSAARTVVYFPGSTIGNFPPRTAARLLGQIARMAGAGGSLLIGIDLQKSEEVIEAAYNDAAGVTAEFNLNLLRRMNSELDGDFELGQFQHVAEYNREEGRIEMYLESRREQVARVGGERFQFGAGERILTEYSCKYTIEGFSALAGEAGWCQGESWTDEREYFAVMQFHVDSEAES